MDGPRWIYDPLEWVAYVPRIDEQEGRGTQFSFLEEILRSPKTRDNFRDHPFRDLAGNSLDQDSTTAGNQPKTWTFKVG